jgi:hypothetical protein
MIKLLLYYKVVCVGIAPCGCLGDGNCILMSDGWLVVAKTITGICRSRSIYIASTAGGYWSIYRATWQTYITANYKSFWEARTEVSVYVCERKLWSCLYIQQDRLIHVYLLAHKPSVYRAAITGFCGDVHTATIFLEAVVCNFCNAIGETEWWIE